MQKKENDCAKRLKSFLSQRICHRYPDIAMNRLPQKISLAAQTAAVILEEIEAGRWVRSLPGEHELCAQLHVSRRTVRTALEQLSRSGAVKCSHGRRREIVSRRSIPKKSASNRVLLLMPAPLQAFSSLVVFLIDHLREHLMESGYVLETHSNRMPFRGRAPIGLESLAKTIRPAGWVLLQSTESMQRWFSARKLPCVVVGSRYNGIALPSVDRDYGAICQHAVNQFVARGHKRLVLLSPQPRSAGDDMTITGFLEAIAKVRSREVHGIVQEHDGTIPKICAQVDALLSSPQPPTAFFVSRARHVLTVLGHLWSSGLNVPRDAALISRDDDSFLSDVVPSVARYSPNQGIFAKKVSRVVMEVLRGEVRTLDHRIMPTFISGKTLNER